MSLAGFIKEKEELLMLTHGQYTPRDYPETVYAADGLILRIDKDPDHVEDGHCAYLLMDGKIWMSTHRGEHFDMWNAVQHCPGNARVFIGGLGLGLILLYLARSRKVREALVVEIDPRVIKTIEPRIRFWFSKTYPEFKWCVIKGDAEKEAEKHGIFDWFFWDIWATPEFSEDASRHHQALSKPFLSDRGIVTTWHDLAKMRKEAKYG